MSKIVLLAGIATAALSLFLFAPRLTKAANSPGVALSGQVSSEKEGAMEGVVVGAKKDGSTITIDVVSDRMDTTASHPRSSDPASTPLRFELSVTRWMGRRA